METDSIALAVKSIRLSKCFTPSQPASQQVVLKHEIVGETRAPNMTWWHLAVPLPFYTAS